MEKGEFWPRGTEAHWLPPDQNTKEQTRSHCETTPTALWMTLAELLIQDEGLRLKVYLCPAGKWTIGVGRNVQDLGISEQEALMLLQNDIVRVQNEALRVFPWYLDLDDVRRDAMLAMLFQMGLPRFLTFSKMIAALKRGNFDRARLEMLDSLWGRQVPERAERLAEMMRSGRYPTDG